MHDQDQHDCVFCKILAGDAPGYIVRENETAVALLDINPLASGHCLVIPRRHVPWWYDLTPDEISGLFRLAQETAQRIMAVFEPDFIGMFARGRRIPHTHIFLIPTNKGEAADRVFNVLEGFQEAVVPLSRVRQPDAMGETMRKLKGDR